MEEGSSDIPELQKSWMDAQDLLRRRLVTEDSFTWRLPSPTFTKAEEEVLKYVGGVDLSFSKDDPSLACAALVVLNLSSLQVVYENFSILNLHVPYVPGFLAFREAPALLDLLERMRSNGHPLYPQLLMVDGNGLLHPRGFGLACHLGVQANLPTIGIGKNLHHVDGISQLEVRKLLEARGNSNKDYITLTGCSGQTLGLAVRSTQSSLNPIFVSIGHRVSLATAIEVVKMTCKYRVPEPIRQADIRSRDYLRNH